MSIEVGERFYIVQPDCVQAVIVSESPTTFNLKRGRRTEYVSVRLESDPSDEWPTHKSNLYTDPLAAAARSAELAAQCERE